MVGRNPCAAMRLLQCYTLGSLLQSTHSLHPPCHLALTRPPAHPLRRHVGCADLHCALCSQNQLRRCARPFMPKYLSGDVIRAACGAVIR